MPYTPILGTLGFVQSKDRQKILMVHRTYRDDDHHLGKYNGLGGKMEAEEDVFSCMRREIQEEAGIIATEMTLRGTVNWTNFGPNGEDWLGFIFLVTDYSGEPKKENEEGPLEWVYQHKLMDLPMWEGDYLFLPLVFDENPRPFHGFMPYENGSPKSWHFHR